MLPQQDIQRYGGKAAILNHIREKLPGMPIPNYVVREFGQNVDSALPDFNSMKKPVIVRSSSPHEYSDFEGIFESVPDVHDRNDLQRAIKNVERSATSERASEYARQNGFKIDEIIHTIIQEQSHSKYAGAMMRHPNNPDLIFIHYYSGSGKYERNHYRFAFDERTGDKADLDHFTSSAISGQNVEFLVEQYKKLETLTEIVEGHSLFVEFGFNPFALYQARPFKKIETANFEVPKIKSEDGLWSDFCFGITPPSGYVLPVVRGLGSFEAKLYIQEPKMPDEGMIRFPGAMDMELWSQLGNLGMLRVMGETSIDVRGCLINALKFHNLSLSGELKEPFCYITSSANRDDYDVDLSVPRMKALVMGESSNFLVHGLMRLIKKADVTLARNSIFNKGIYQNTKSLEDKVRIISNGKEAVVMRES